MLSVTTHNRLLRSSFAGRSSIVHFGCEMFDGRAADAGRRHLSARRSVADAEGRCWRWCVDDRLTDRRHDDCTGHQSRKQRVTMQCTQSSSVLDYRSFQRVCCRALSNENVAAPGAQFVPCRPVSPFLLSLSPVVCRMIDSRLIAWICSECYSSAELILHKRIKYSENASISCL